MRDATEFARTLRRRPTAAEEMLWRDLRARRLDGAKFRRQVPVGRYVADFVCLEARLIVELDEAPHQDPRQREHDVARDAWLRAQGFRVLRFPNDVILGGSGELVLREIRSALVAPSSDPRSREGHLLPPGEKERRHARRSKLDASTAPSPLAGEGVAAKP